MSNHDAGSATGLSPLGIKAPPAPVRALYRTDDSTTPSPHFPGAIPLPPINPIHVGHTSHFDIYSAGPSQDKVQPAVDAIVNTIENTYQTLTTWFGVADPPQNVKIDLIPQLGGAGHFGCDGTELFCDWDPSQPAAHSAYLACAELVEVFSAIQNKGWNCGASNGEALSRVLAAALYPHLDRAYATGQWWLNSDRPDYVNQTFASDTDLVSTGCSVLYLNYLRYQLQFDWGAIVQAGGTTLAQTFAALTNSNDAFAPFQAVLNAYFPYGSQTNALVDNPFPLAVSPRLQIAYTPAFIPIDQPVTILFSGLDASTGENVTAADILFNGTRVGSTGTGFAYTFKSTWTNRTVIGVDGKPHVIKVKTGPSITCIARKQGYPDTQVGLKYALS